MGSAGADARWRASPGLAGAARPWLGAALARRPLRAPRPRAPAAARRPRPPPSPPPGETLPDEGTVWKHPNLRLAYVAQHAFHHVEQHLDMTPSQYIWWR